MARRPLFVPQPKVHPFVDVLNVEFEWHPGFSLAQAQRNIAALHRAARHYGIMPILEISSKSPDVLGVALSAFNLTLTVGGHTMSVECAFQGSKVFANGGPYQDLYCRSSREAKVDERIRQARNFVGFRLYEDTFPIQPVTAFYDWLYLTALQQHPDLSVPLLNCQAFSDIAFNPDRSISCQARSAALFVALVKRDQLKDAMRDKLSFLAAMSGNGSKPELLQNTRSPHQLGLWPDDGDS